MADANGTIGKGIRVKGEVTGSGSLVVDGELEGKVELDALVIESSGTVNAEMKASEITVSGRASGNMDAGRRISVRASATVEGEVKSPSIVVEEGAVFRGRVHMDTGIPEDV